MSGWIYDSSIPFSFSQTETGLKDAICNIRRSSNSEAEVFRWPYHRILNSKYDSNTEKYLSLITVAQQVIENAQNNNLDAQFTVLAAATNILSEAEQDDSKAKPIADELERNADDKCRIHNAYMNGQARIVEDRYNEMRVDPLFLYRDYRTTPHPNGYGSWNGHQLRYTYEQGLLNQKILDAFFAGCPETTKATEWKNKPAPQKPDYAM